jgi:hypothetical protein
MSDEAYRNLDDYIKDRNRALTEMDLAWARRMIAATGGASDDATLLLAMHKARYTCTHIARELRLASAEWLRARGFGGPMGEPLLPPGQLPR